MTNIDDCFVDYPDQEKARELTQKIVPLDRRIIPIGLPSFGEIQLRLGSPSAWCDLPYNTSVEIPQGQLVERNNKYQVVLRTLNGTINDLSHDFIGLLLPDNTIAYVYVCNKI